MNLTELKLSKMKTILDDIKNKNQKAIAQEELLLNQLKEEFSVETLEEGYDLYNQLVEERDSKEIKVANQTESLYNSLVSEGLIDATQ